MQLRYLIIFLILFLFTDVKASNFEITPINFDFEGIAVQNDTIIAYGSFGSAMISFDSGRNWHQKQFFKGGTIIKIFFTFSKLFAFNSLGTISVSEDGGLNWKEIKFSDTILAVIQYNNGFLVRTPRKLLTIDFSLNYISEFQLTSDPLRSINFYHSPNYKMSLTYFKENFIVETDSSNFIRFTEDLIPLDTLSFTKLGIFSKYFKYASGYCLDSDSSRIYMKLIASQRDSTKPNQTGKIVPIIFKTFDFKSLSLFDSLYALFSDFKLVNGSLFVLNKTEKYLSDTTKFFKNDITSRLFKMKDFTIIDDKLFVVGNGKNLLVFDYRDSILNVLSDAYDIAGTFVPEKINDSTWLFYSIGRSYGMGPYINRTDNDGFTFRPVVDISNYKNNLLFYYNRYHFVLIENNGAKFTFGGTNENDYRGYLLVSTDTCRTFTKIEKPTLSLASYSGFLNASKVPNLCIGDGWYSMASGIVIYNYDKNFERTSYFRDTSVIFDYVYTKDTISYLVHCANKTDSTSEIRYTGDQGKNWVLIKKFQLPETASHYNEIKVNNINYLTIVHSNLYERMRNPDSPAVSSVDLVNLENNEYRRLFHWTSPDGNLEYGTMGIAVTSDDDTAYIAFQDTLFVIPDLDDKTAWRYYLMPTPGSRMIRPIKKYGDRFFGRYADEYNPWAGYSAWFKPLGPLLDYPVSVDESEIKTYLTYLPPYPNPAGNLVRADIYWDTRYDIDNADIGIFNYAGIKISDKKNITIDKKSNFGGTLVWDCSSYSPGVYFIIIRHGNASRLIPIVVNR